MKIDQILWGLLSLYGVLYIILYLGYTYLINVLLSSYNAISISAVLLPFIILLVILFVLWKRTDINLRIARKVKTKFNVITILGIVPPLYCSVLLGVNEYKSNFSEETWFNNHTERVYMIDDLLNDYELKGKTKDEVIKLLGTPTETEYFKDDHNIVYYLGYERGLVSIDSEWLVIDFDDNEKVKKYEVLTD